MGLNGEYAAELWHSQLRLAQKGSGAPPPFALESSDALTTGPPA